MFRREFLAQTVVLATTAFAAVPEVAWAKPRKTEAPLPVPATKRGTATGTSWEDCGRTVIRDMGRPAPGWIRLSSTVVIVYASPGIWRGTWELTDVRQEK